ncbi:MAG: DNA mismatch repair protein MutS, partial [Alphaproteobacteria bacterium]|nr:DNA mismatch repair protein MutS [Alphaproteobacteria bacterium]
SLLGRLSPGELLIPDNLLQKADLFKVLNEYREKLSVLPQARFNYANSQKQMLDFFKVGTLDSFGEFSKAEIISAGVLLDYIYTTQKGKMPRILHPIRIKNSAFMEIDAATMHNLDLLDGPNGATLVSAIDRTVTGAGARMLASRIATPLLDIEKIKQRQDVLEFFCKHEEVRSKLRNLLKQCPDVERCVSRLSIGRGGPRDLLSILQTLASLAEVRNILNIYKRIDVLDEHPKALDNVIAKLGDYYVLIDELNRALKKDDLPMLARDGNFVAEDYSPELDALRKMKEDGHQYIINMQSKYVAETGIDHLKIKYNNVIGYFIEVPAKFATQLLENPKFIHRQSVLNAARFATAELTNLENDIRSAAEKVLAIEISIFENLVKDVLIEADDITKTANALAELDIGAALADLAVENSYVRPQLDDSLIFDVKDGRHPVVENALRKDNEGSFVGNDCYLCGDSNRIWLLTGPNMAGKSTFLRQNAIIAIMAQIGSFVPAKSAHIGIVDKIFSRVGASDDLSRGRSTFMVEMVETASILNRATERSFVILDEIGRGTATFDGLSIAWAVVEYLHEVNKSRALFATHYHELAVLAEKLPALTLHCMKIKEFNEQVIFLHEVIDGAADRSYGVHVAKLAGLPKSVITRAEQVLKNLEKDNQRHLNVEAELPLFSFVLKEENKSGEKLSKLEEAIRQISPDDMTAREALDKLYELKEMVKER